MSAVTDALHHEATNDLVPMWRTLNEAQRWDHFNYRLRLQGTNQVLGTVATVAGIIIIGLLLAGVVQGGDRVPMFVAGPASLVVGIFTVARFSLRKRRTIRERLAVEPFYTTLDGAKAYQAMWADEQSDHARAEQFRKALSGLSGDEQVTRPEYAALLVLGKTAADRA